MDKNLYYNVTHFGVCIDDYMFVRNGKVIEQRTFCYEGETYIEEKHGKRVLSLKKKEDVWGSYLSL